MRKIATYIATLIVLFGVFGFFFNIFLSQNSVYNGELPLSGIQGIKEQNGKIYVGLGQYNRIQVYDLNGKFTQFINTNNHSKDYDFKIDEQGNPIINVIYLRKNSIEKYIQNNGTEYRIGNIIPRTIERKDSHGKRQIITQPLHMSFWGGCINSWIITLIGSFFFYLTNSSVIMDLAGLNITKEEQMKLFFKRIFL